VDLVLSGICLKDWNGHSRGIWVFPGHPAESAAGCSALAAI